MDESVISYLKEARNWIKGQLDSSIDFWLEHGMDHENGGVYTCLDREGNIYSTDKSVWMQGRCAWTYSYLCHIYGVKDEWLNAAKSCLDFLEEHCINRQAGNRLYFQVTAEGKPLRQRRYNFSEGFYCIANAEYYGVTHDEECLRRARDAYAMIKGLNNGAIEDPVGLGPKVDPDTRSTLALGDPMIFLNIIGIMRRVDPERTEMYDQDAQACLDRIIEYHFKPELGCTLESVSSNGDAELWYTAGRVVNPGHNIECSWFMMDEANYRKDQSIHEVAEKIFRYAIEAGWDEEYQGILYFIDAKGLPTEAYEHDMKLWWPHNETLIASIKAYRDTSDEYYLDWFKKTLQYCKDHFADPEYGEWFGYLRRDGIPTMPAVKGSTFKGPFHVPRALCMVDQIIGDVLGE